MDNFLTCLLMFFTPTVVLARGFHGGGHFVGFHGGHTTHTFHDDGGTHAFHYEDEDGVNTTLVMKKQMIPNHLAQE